MERETPRRRRVPVPLRMAARECHTIPQDLAEKDTAELSGHTLSVIEFMESWKDIKAVLNKEAPGFLPAEIEIDIGAPVRTNRSQPLGGGAAEDWLSNATDSEKLAAACKLSSNMLAFDLLTGKGLPPHFRMRDLSTALKELSQQLLEWPDTAVGSVPNVAKLENLPRMSADTVLRSIKGKLSSTALMLSRFTIVPFVCAYKGVSVFMKEMVYYLRIDNAEFKLGKDFVPDTLTARDILRHWEHTGGGRFEVYELTPEEEERIPMLMGLISYRNANGVHRFTVTTPPVAVSRTIPSIYTALDDATYVVGKFEEYLGSWTPPPQFGPDHIPLFAEICRNVTIDWDRLTLQDSRDRYLEYYQLSLATMEEMNGFTEGEIADSSLIERADMLLEKAAARRSSADLMNAFKTPEAHVGRYSFTTEPSEVMARLNASRDQIRNTYGQREHLFRGNTYPGLAFGSPDGASTYLKVREVLNRLYALDAKNKERAHVLMGVGYTLAMGPAFPPNTQFCDVVAPKHVARHVPITIANALSLRCEDGTTLDIDDKVYISDVYGGPTKPSEHYRQIDAVCMGRPACGAIKCFLDSPRVVSEAVCRLSQYYRRVFYCGVTKAHTGEYFMCFADRKDKPTDEAERGVSQQCRLFLALHSGRTDLANYLYTGHVRAGVFDFTKFRRIDAVFQRHGQPYLGKPWVRTVHTHEIENLTGKKERTGTMMGVETMSLAELEEMDMFEELASVDQASEISDSLPPKNPALVRKPEKRGYTPHGDEEDVETMEALMGAGEEEGDEAEPSSDYGTGKYSRGKGGSTSARKGKGRH